MELTDKLLQNILPQKIIDRLKHNFSEGIADKHQNVSVMFADIVGFTSYCSKHDPQEGKNENKMRKKKKRKKKAKM